MASATSVKKILAADIGGTHSRFALFLFDTDAVNPLEGLTLVRSVRFRTNLATSTKHMMLVLAQTPGTDGGFLTPFSPVPETVDAAVFGIPGPTALADTPEYPLAQEVCHCPNIAWPLEAATIAAALDGAPVRLINDFVANGFACGLLPGIVEAEVVLEGKGRQGFSRAVIGGGTGLGHCLILPGSNPLVLGAEAGHALFPFTAAEEDIARYIAAFSGKERPDGDDVVSGSGLAAIYAYHTGEKLVPYDVPSLAAQHPETLEMMARFYGRAVCHYTINTLALGGVFILGGLAANLPQVLTHPEFRKEFRDRNVMRHILGEVPLWHVRNQDSGLWGAAACAARMAFEMPGCGCRDR